MKRTILVLTLIVLLSSATLGASPDDGDIRIPLPTRSLSSGDAGDQINLANSLMSNSNGVIISLLALLY